MYKVVDLFAGAGGLSLGFMQTRKYDIKVAFENSPYMQETYRLNHPGVEVQGDVCAANYDEIKEKYGDIDVLKTSRRFSSIFGRNSITLS